MGFLFTRANAKMNPMFSDSIFKFWAGLRHPKVYLLLNGMEVDDEEAGLTGLKGLIEKKGYVRSSHRFSRIQLQSFIPTSSILVTSDVSDLLNYDMNSGMRSSPRQ